MGAAGSDAQAPGKKRKGERNADLWYHERQGSEALLSMNRYRLLQFSILVFLAFWLFLAVLGRNRGKEIFPFFCWELFSGTPKWHITQDAVFIHSIDGAPASGIRYLNMVPGIAARAEKVLVNTLGECRSDLAGCNDVIEKKLYPLINEFAGEVSEFSIVTVRIDLREAQRNIKMLAEGKLSRSDFYRQGKVFGRWTADKGWGTIFSGNYKSSKLLVRSHFDVYHNGNSLTYVKESCGRDDTDTRFFLHLYPLDENDLPDDRKQYGFDNYDFSFNEQFQFNKDGECITVRDIPGYGIASIHTGQFINGKGVIWEADFALHESAEER